MGHYCFLVGRVSAVSSLNFKGDLNPCSTKWFLYISTKGVTCNLRKKGAKKVLCLSCIWNALWFLKEPLKVLKVLYTLQNLQRFPERVLGFSGTFFKGSRAEGTIYGTTKNPFSTIFSRVYQVTLIVYNSINICQKKFVENISGIIIMIFS